MLIGLRAMAKAVPQIEALAKLIVFMDETVIGQERTRPQESLTTLQQRTSDPTPDVGGPQVDPKEFRPPRRQTHVAKSNDLIGIERHGSSTSNRLSLPKSFQSVSDQNAFN
jgi:hypothetical protein